MRGPEGSLSEDRVKAWNRYLDESHKAMKEFTDQIDLDRLATRKFQPQFDDGDEE